jgi:tetraacyldisaccharide 4'-kinase
MSVLRLLLLPFSLLYGAVVWVRNRLYDTGKFLSMRFDIPVIVVGNLSAGGTGKTPHVEYLVELLRSRFKVATMSRGYRRRTRGFMLADEQSDALQIGDEPMQYHMKFPDIAVSVAEQRVLGIPYLLQQRPETDVIVLDDAYQHRKLRPGLGILITDYSRPFYEDRLLPVGRLREHRGGYKRADLIIVSKCPPDLQPAAADAMVRRIAPLPGQEVFFSTIQYQAAYDLFTHAPASFAGRHVLLVCCIANPAPLISKVKATAARVEVMTYPDHHYFRTSDLEAIGAAWERLPAAGRLILTTEKDAARLQLHAAQLRELQMAIAVLPLKVEFLFGAGERFDQKVLGYTEKTLAAYRTAGENEVGMFP